MRIAIVNDLRTAVEGLKRIITTNPNLEIAWIAWNGAEAVKKCKEDLPDLILMDLIMPVMGGEIATKLIMESTPCAILVVTATIKGNVSKVFQAMGYGALDVVHTPAIDLSKSDLGGKDLLNKIERIAALIGKRPHKKQDTENWICVSGRIPPLVAVGASTGGPGALVKIISEFPASLPFAMVIIQHVDEEFAQSMAQWLSQETEIPVQLAVEGITPSKGSILLAGRDDHLVITENLTLSYSTKPIHNPYRPSVDEFFFSAAKYWPIKSVGVLLTGMGSDGALGLKALKDIGWDTIAQSEETCVAPSMPRSAIEIGGANKVLPLENISDGILGFFKVKLREA